jgi:hypothetical protein
MAETTVTSQVRAGNSFRSLLSGAAWCAVIVLGLVVAAELAFFALHAAHLLSYPYPLDYGEGPLLAQIDLLRAGTPIWRLYSDPGASPYAVVNYPPVYHLLAALFATLIGDTLLAGRLVSLVATLAAVAALWQLTDDRRPKTDERRPTNDSENREPTLNAQLSSPIPRTDHPSRRTLLRILIVLAFLGLPIVREWAVVMRVDMLGLALGLWGLVLAQRGLNRGGMLWAALPLTLSLFVKPSLIAAPAATLLWLLFRDWRRALGLALAIAMIGGLAFVVLQLASGGWFAIHVLTANNNAWQFDLAQGFWRDQLTILWPLLVPTAVLALAVILAGPQLTTDYRLPTTDHQPPKQHREPPRGYPTENRNPQPLIGFSILNSQFLMLLPLCYTLFGAIVAFGIGKVGAYANYFLEFYAGLIWSTASLFQLIPADRFKTTDTSEPAPRKTYRALRKRVLGSWFLVFNSGYTLVGSLCIIAALSRYYPLWSETYLKPYGMIEQQHPPRVAFGQYGVWKDLQREHAILTTFGGVNAALNDEVRAAGGPIFTDVPGVAAQAGQLARLQSFEHRQLYDAKLWDQRPLLRDLANGRVPLVALDYLGNWMTPEMIALITHRYAQDGSRGTYDLYRPVAIGPLAAADLSFAGGPHLIGYHLALSAGRPIYAGGETVLLTLDWKSNPSSTTERVETGSSPSSLIEDGRYEVVAQLVDDQGNVLLETARPLLYGALQLQEWSDDSIQHLQPITLPPGLPTANYGLAVTLRWEGRELAQPRALTRIVVEEQGGRLLGEQGYFVPKLLLDVWRQLGGYEGPGDPLMPAAPFAGYTAQCFVRDCLRLSGQGVERVPLGELIHLVDVGLPKAIGSTTTSLADTAIQHFPETNQQLSGAFFTYWRENGAMARLGPPISGELLRGDRIVQYTRYARLERPASGDGEVRLGRLGEEYLRLPGGVTYRWP